MSSRSEGKKKNPHRSWTKKEEEVLLSAVKGLVADGWKTDNGFKSGYYRELELAMQKVFPGTDIRGKPHIESKLTGWKRTYAALTDILNTSGVGFNLNGENQIDVGNEQWEGMVSQDSSIRKWRFKNWDHFEDWRIIFGKDRATGENAAQFMDMVNDLLLDSEGAVSKDQEPAGESMGNTGENPNLSTAEDYGTQSSAGTSKQPKQRRKRQFEDSLSSLVDLVGEIQKTNVAKFDAFNEKFAKPVVVNKLRPDLWPILQAINGLTLNQAFQAVEILYENPARMQFFLELSDDARPAYIGRILNIDI